MIGELMMQRAGVNLVGVAFRGSADAINALLGKVVHFTFADGALVLPLVQAGSFRALAVTGRKRSAIAPDLPTMPEAGIPDFEATSFFGIVAPAGTPEPVITLLNATLNEGLRSEKSKGLIAQLGFVSEPSTAEEFGTFIVDKARQWRTVADAAGIKIGAGEKQ